MSLWIDGNTIAVFQLCTEGLISTTHILQCSRGQTNSGFLHVLLSIVLYEMKCTYGYFESTLKNKVKLETDMFHCYTLNVSSEKYQMRRKMEPVNRTFPNIVFPANNPRKRLLHHSLLLEWQAVANPTTQKLPPCSLPQRLFDVIVFLSHQFSPMFHNGQSSILAVWSPLNGVYSASTDDNIEQYNERSSCDTKMRCHTFLLPTINFTDEVKHLCWWKDSDLLYFCTPKKSEAQKIISPTNLNPMLRHL